MSGHLSLKMEIVAMASKDNYQELFDVTCALLRTFKGEKGRAVVDEVHKLMHESPALRQFIFDFYYNVKASVNHEENH